jgi:two-component system, NtrC family, nitrogen regulation sensor histidine kinase NtrY
VSPRPLARFETTLVLLALAGGAPAVLVTIALLAAGELSAKVVWTVGPLCVACWIVVPFWLRDRITGRLRTLSSVLEAFREGDYSVRGRHSDRDGALGSAMRELNALGDALRDHRLGAIEASNLLERVMASIDVVVMAVDDRGVVRLANRAAESLVGRPASELVGASVRGLGLEDLLEGEAPRLFSPVADGATGPFELRRSDFRLAGRPHTLLVLADLHRALRDQEREAWRRLVRVLGHEINSSLAPIQSIGQSLVDLAGRSDRPADWEDDLGTGLSVITRRAGALARFMVAYSKLARLPPPTLAPVEVRSWAERVATLETRSAVHIEGGPDVTIEADGDQLDQLLLNLVKNAADACADNGGGVRVRWTAGPQWMEIRVEDDGPGISDTKNLFVPFFTTKPDGTGIGLALSRQIAEGHGGTLHLEPGPGGRGAVARLRLPVSAA